jgi:hypothetical protein
MKVGDHVRLVDAPAGWGDTTGYVIPDDDNDCSGAWVLVEWNNGETCYERPAALELT